MIVYPVISPMEESPSFARICRAFRAALPFLDRDQIVEAVRNISTHEYMVKRFDEGVDDPSVWELRRLLFIAGQWMNRNQVQELADWAQVVAYQELRRRAIGADCFYIPPKSLKDFVCECWPETSREVEGKEAE